MKVPLSDFIQNIYQAPSKLDYLKSNHNIWKIIYFLGSYEHLKRLEGKIRKRLLFYVKIF